MKNKEEKKPKIVEFILTTSNLLYTFNTSTISLSNIYFICVIVTILHIFIFTYQIQFLCIVIQWVHLYNAIER